MARDGHPQGRRHQVHQGQGMCRGWSCGLQARAKVAPLADEWQALGSRPQVNVPHTGEYPRRALLAGLAQGCDAMAAPPRGVPRRDSARAAVSSDRWRCCEAEWISALPRPRVGEHEVAGCCRRRGRRGRGLWHVERALPVLKPQKVRGQLRALPRDHSRHRRGVPAPLLTCFLLSAHARLPHHQAPRPVQPHAARLVAALWPRGLPPACRRHHRGAKSGRGVCLGSLLRT
mmetsp:Transcript_59279/g.152601  ORF Transcript_59279/g.152601 Transcript_59279/m.152601 type:complete len:231 (-) Transcript_59279:297-989(-)